MYGPDGKVQFIGLSRKVSLVFSPSRITCQLGSHQHSLHKPGPGTLHGIAGRQAVLVGDSSHWSYMKMRLVSVPVGAGVIEHREPRTRVAGPDVRSEGGHSGRCHQGEPDGCLEAVDPGGRCGHSQAACAELVGLLRNSSTDNVPGLMELEAYLGQSFA